MITTEGCAEQPAWKSALRNPDPGGSRADPRETVKQPGGSSPPSGKAVGRRLTTVNGLGGRHGVAGAGDRGMPLLADQVGRRRDLEDTEPGEERDQGPLEPDR
jgi:hypothetical protein